MSKCIEHREFIPVAEVPAEISDGIAAKYYVRWPGSFHEITQDNLKRIMKNLPAEIGWTFSFITRRTRRATTWTWRQTGPSTT